MWLTWQYLCATGRQKDFIHINKCFFLKKKSESKAQMNIWNIQMLQVFVWRLIFSWRFVSTAEHNNIYKYMGIVLSVHDILRQWIKNNNFCLTVCYISDDRSDNA